MWSNIQTKKDLTSLSEVADLGMGTIFSSPFDYTDNEDTAYVGLCLILVV